MILAAEERGELKPGGLIVEGTAGNTGIGLALVAKARGYRTIIVIPDTQSQEKKDTLRLAGAALIEVPAKPYSDPNNYQHVARRLADLLRGKREARRPVRRPVEQPRTIRAAHYLTTGPEIWRDTGGKIDGFICSVGTGGTLAGVSLFLREKKHGSSIGCADPEGAAMFNLFTHGEAKVEPREFHHRRHRPRPLDADRRRHRRSTGPTSSPTREALPIIFDLVEHEGLILGGSSGINIAGAIRLARELGRATPSSRSSPTTARATSRSCSIRHFCKANKLPVPAGWTRANRHLKCRISGPDRWVRQRFLFPRRRLSAGGRGDGAGGQRSPRHRARPHRLLRHQRRPARRHRRLRRGGGTIAIATTVYGDDKSEIVHVPGDGETLPEPGETVTAAIDWERRYRHMRIHTGLHLLSVVLPFPVTGGSIGADEGRLDFDIDGEVPAKEAIEEQLNALVAADYPVSDEWITDEELLANPGLVKTMKVKPPMGSGRVRLVRIGDIDLQPCGGTHVRSTAEIGRLAIGKIESKGRQNRRVRIRFADPDAGAS